jgi:hypothetical protein
LGSAVAIIAAFTWANFQSVLNDHGAVQWEDTSRLIPWQPGAPTWHHLPRVAVVLAGIGLLSRWLGMLVGLALPDRRWWVKNLLVWLPRWVAILVVGPWVTPAELSDKYAWLKPALAAAMLFTWVAVDGLSRFISGAQASFALSAVYFAAGVVFLYSHSNKFFELALVFSLALAAVGLVSHVGRTDASGAIAATAGLLAPLTLNVRLQTDIPENHVPAACYWLVGLAPLVLLPFLLPQAARMNRWVLVMGRFFLLSIPLVAAVSLAMANEKLPIGDEEETGAKE